MDAPDRPVATADSAARFEATARLIIEIAAAASGELDLDQILHEALDRLRAVVRLTGGSIALVDGDDLVDPGRDRPVRRRGPSASACARGPSRSWGVVERLEPYRTGDLFRDGDRVRGRRAGDAVRSWLAVPIVRHGRGIGLLEIDSTEIDAFGPADEDLLVGGRRASSRGHVELAAPPRRRAALGGPPRSLHRRDQPRAPDADHDDLRPGPRCSASAATTLDPAARTEAIADIEAESDRLYRLVEDLLVLSRAESGRVEIEPRADQPDAVSSAGSWMSRRPPAGSRVHARGAARTCR